jgi:hypothetical protein
VIDIRPLSANFAETLMLNDFISLDGLALTGSQDAVRTVDTLIAGEIPAESLTSADGDWHKALAAIFGINIGRMFKAACLKFSADAPKPDLEPDGTANLTILPFVVESSHHPRIVMTYGQFELPLKFDIELSLEVDGAVLHVRDGRFVGASTGTARCVARMSLLNAKPPIELGSPTFKLPGELEFAEPVLVENSL